MPVQATQYELCKQYRHDGTLDLNSNTIMLALIANTYTPNYPTHGTFSDVSANEVAAGNGYTSGGKALTGLSVNSLRFDADNLTFAGLTKTFRYGCLYALGTLNGVVDPLIGLILFDDTPADVVVTASDYNVLWNPSGIITF